ncbi:hypothetical protein FOZ61_004699 [Perkinsus olseni]|uniref:Cation efflux protein transmembrane domain-containing protein n=1 Tax=Perkinsus olseni TaxID=32597 RepID=A0A7J6LK33_PEROL|nr:hypothetical protein FOZ61_004699 [Perkinsus olseni]
MPSSSTLDSPLLKSRGTEHPAAIKGEGSFTNPRLTVVAIPKEKIVPAPSSGRGHIGEGHEQAKDVQRRLRRAICLSCFFMILEIVGGILAHSLAIVTDAAHIMSDVSGFAVSLFAVVLAGKTPTSQYTYGYRQAEILGALFSVMIVWFMTGVLLWEAIQRFINLEEVNGGLMSIMALIGLLVNFCLMATLGHNHTHGGGAAAAGGHGHSHGKQGDIEEGGHTHTHSHDSHNLALDAAVVHVLGDIIQSLGVLLAAVLIYWKPFNVGHVNGVSKWNYADPACTILFSILVMFTTFKTVKQSVHILMQRVPDSVDVDLLQTKLRHVEHVQCVHDVHVWSVGSSGNICTAHIVVSGCSNCSQVLNEATKVANDMGISHTTFQLEARAEDVDVDALQSSCCHNQACNKGDDTCGAPSEAISAPVVIVSPRDASPLLRAQQPYGHEH